MGRAESPEGGGLADGRAQTPQATFGRGRLPPFVSRGLPRKRKGHRPNDRETKGNVTSMPPGTWPGTGDRPAFPRMVQAPWVRGGVAGAQGTSPEFPVDLLDLSTYNAIRWPRRPGGYHLSLVLGRCCLIGNVRPGTKRGVTSKECGTDHGHRHRFVARCFPLLEGGNSREISPLERGKLSRIFKFRFVAKVPPLKGGNSRGFSVSWFSPFGRLEAEGSGLQALALLQAYGSSSPWTRPMRWTRWNSRGKHGAENTYAGEKGHWESQVTPKPFRFSDGANAITPFNSGEMPACLSARLSRGLLVVSGVALKGLFLAPYSENERG